MKVKTATEAKLHFGHILDKAAHEPIIIQKSGRNVAVILSFDEYQRIIKAEDKYWIKKAQDAHKAGFIGTKTSEKLLDDLLNAED